MTEIFFSLYRERDISLLNYGVEKIQELELLDDIYI